MFLMLSQTFKAIMILKVPDQNLEVTFRALDICLTTILFDMLL